jgi:phosphatidate phosphatase APP1
MSYYIKRFLVANNLPFGPCVLRDWGPEEDRAFTSGKQHKTESIKSLFRRYPESKWILIGDNGQHDPEIYGDLFQAYQKKIQRIIIREFTNKPRSKKLLVSKERTQAQVIYGFDGYALSNSFLNDFNNLLK